MGPRGPAHGSQRVGLSPARSTWVREAIGASLYRANRVPAAWAGTLLPGARWRQVHRPLPRHLQQAFLNERLR
jgi:streptogramin lyase